jgi:predicted ATPase with chaperone activity
MESVRLLPAPQSIRETGLNRNLVENLAVKALFLYGDTSLSELAERMCLSLAVVEEIFAFLRKEQLCEVTGMAWGSHRIVASSRGREQAIELLGLSQYAGPAPVPLESYVLRVRSQSIQQTEIDAERLVGAFRDIVINEDVVARIGAAVVSGTSLFLYGPSGTGKTSISECIPAVFDDAVWIPYAVEVDNQIISVFDRSIHRPITIKRPATEEEIDTRWVLCQRPRVVAGGELSLEMLDLQFSSTSRYYMAPLQMKANNGVLVIDDLGRQRVRPEELFNRWMTPLDRRVDFISVPGGRKFEIPFDVFVIFATNLDPSQFADEAFLRRIPNKIMIGYATPQQFAQIFRKTADTLLLDYDDSTIARLIALITGVFKRPLRPCYARDILQQISWTAAFRKEQLRVGEKIIEAACRNYFLSDNTSSDI